MAKFTFVLLFLVTLTPLIWTPANQVVGVRVLEVVPDAVLIPYKLKSELGSVPEDVKLCRPNCTYRGCFPQPPYDKSCCGQIRCALPGKPFNQCYFSVISCNCTNCS